ncbi:SpoIIAA family protein [Lysobacter brunescens]|uniref:STAS/SEC14 domain-containing protein n=1 Tax=Lysobacter brunescens TaxID=262323 RepID=A0ABW2YAV1_9GAMM
MDKEQPGDASRAQAPAYRLSFAHADGFLRVQVSGDIDAQDVRIAYWREIVATARERGERRLLVLDRKKGTPATPDELAEMAGLFSADAAHFERIAVIEPTTAFLPAMEHAEIQGRSVGINVRIFGDEANAERWLLFGTADD